jgi:hypothetical protein
MVAGMNNRMTPQRIAALHEQLVTAASTIERALRGERWARYETRS